MSAAEESQITVSLLFLSSKQICVAPKADENTSIWLSRNASSKKPNALWRNRAPLHLDAPSHIDPVHIADKLLAIEFPESAPCLTKTTCDTLTSRSTVLHRHHTKVLADSSKMAQAGEYVLTKTQGGIFKLELFLPDDYPMTPPKIRFLTKIFHPNVDKLGRICLDVLKSALLKAILFVLGILYKYAYTSSQTTGLLRCRSGRFCSPSKPSSVLPTPMTPLPPMLLRAGRKTRWQP